MRVLDPRPSNPAGVRAKRKKKHRRLPMFMDSHGEERMPTRRREEARAIEKSG